MSRSKKRRWLNSSKERKFALLPPFCSIQIINRLDEDCSYQLGWSFLGCCSCSVTKSCLTLVTPWTAACQAYLSFTTSQSMLKLMFIKSVMPSNHLILCLTLQYSQHEGLFQWVHSSYQVAKKWNLSFSISPSNEFSTLIYFRIDWFSALAVQETLKSLLQHHSSKVSILRCSAFFMV